jgi:hypothetical protein
MGRSRQAFLDGDYMARKLVKRIHLSVKSTRDDKAFTVLIPPSDINSILERSVWAVRVLCQVVVLSACVDILHLGHTGWIQDALLLYQNRSFSKEPEDFYSGAMFECSHHMKGRPLHILGGPRCLSLHRPSRAA